jgi:hypothetical protein
LRLDAQSAGGGENEERVKCEPRAGSARQRT